MKSQSHLVSFILTLALTVTGTVLTVSIILPAMERQKISLVIEDAIGKMSGLDFLINQLTSGGVGSMATYDLVVEDGKFVVDNKTNMLIFEYEPSWLPFEKVQKKTGNLIISAGSIPDVTCSLKYGSCEADETCLFSLRNETNSHLGNCSVYNYKVCCKNLNVEMGSCTPISESLLSLAKEENSHASYEIASEYNISICIFPQAVCSLREQCTRNEVCIVSFYNDTNSHAAKCGYYKNNLCCEWVVKPVVKIFLKYSNVRLVGSEVFPKGEYKICLKKIEETSSVSTIEIKTC